MRSSRRENDGVERLHRVLKKTCPDLKPIPGHEFLAELLGKKINKYDRLAIGLDCDEVYPNIYIGNRGAAKNKDYLQRLGITHILNAASGRDRDQVDTGTSFYKDTSIKYMGLNITDTDHARIRRRDFEEAAEFIHTAVQKEGKILVHCLMGMSRSGTMVIGYFMIKLGMSAEEALTTVRQLRDIRPNHGFLRQLADLESNLRNSHSESKSRDSDGSQKRNHDSQHERDRGKKHRRH